MDEIKLLARKTPRAYNSVALRNLDEALEFAAKNNHSGFFSPGELKSMCYKAMMDAAPNFDPKKAARFLSYAKTYIRGEIRRETRRRRVVRHSDTLDIEQNLTEDETPRTFMDWEAIHNSECWHIIRAVLHRLTPRERQVILTVFFGGRNLPEAAVVLKVKRQAVHQTMHRALHKLRQYLAKNKSELI